MPLNIYQTEYHDTIEMDIPFGERNVFISAINLSTQTFFIVVFSNLVVFFLFSFPVDL